MTKRVRLLKSVLSFHMNEIMKIQTFDPKFTISAHTISRLSKRIKQAKRKKVKVIQLGFIQTFEAKFTKHKRKTVLTESITALNNRNARKVLKQKFGSKIKILTIKHIQ